MWFRLTFRPSTARKNGSPSPARKGCWGSKAWTTPLYYRPSKTPSARRPAGRAITYTDLYNWKLSGTPGSAERKYALLNALGLPPRLSKKELVEALNRLYSFEELDKLQAEILK